MTDTPRLGFIGTGKVGSALARLWYAVGFQIGVVYNRSPARAAQLGTAVDAVVVDSCQAAAGGADLIFVTVPDDAVQTVAERLAEVDDLEGKGIVHTSGSLDASVLGKLVERGAMVGSLHPAFPFASDQVPPESLMGAVMAVEAEDERLRGWLVDLVYGLGCIELNIRPGRKALYHAALVFTSNYTVTLYSIGQRILSSLGTDRATAEQALRRLLNSTVENIEERGLPEALTGPLARADVGTIRAHLRDLEEFDPVLNDLYRQLALQTLPLVESRGQPIETLRNVLTQGGHDANHGA
jgi:predicted short-subunit dehydrogenase-like oxidoreductase (DUF2520 family)